MKMKTVNRLKFRIHWDRYIDFTEIVKKSNEEWLKSVLDELWQFIIDIAKYRKIEIKTEKGYIDINNL